MACLVGHVVDHHVGSGARQGQNDGLTDPGVAAGDDGDLAVERHRALLLFSMARPSADAAPADRGRTYDRTDDPATGGFTPSGGSG